MFTAKSAGMKISKISVITPSFNQARYLRRTIESVINQKVGCELEYIVVDGLSTDGTLSILKEYENKLKYISEADRGMTEALNKGFSLATGQVFAWLNSDDVYLPGTLEKVVDFFNDHPECSWLYGNCIMIDDADRQIRNWITVYKKWKSSKFSYKRLLVENYISQPAVFFRREAFEKAGGINENLPTAMDYDLWLRLAQSGKPGIIPEFLAGFRVHQASISAGNRRQQFREQYMIHKKYDHNFWLLFRHRVMIAMIISVYGLLNVTGRFQRRNN